MTHPMLAVAIAAVALQGCVVARQPVSHLGRTVRVTPLQADQTELAGELMAVSAESLWVARDSEIVSVPLLELRRVQVRRAERLGGKAMRYSAIVGLVTGGALSAACSQVEGASCGGVLPVVFASWMLWGALSASSVESSAKFGVEAGDWERLRLYARFPQGLPDNFPRRGLSPTTDRRRPAHRRR